MAWDNSNRASRLPPDWPKRRAATLRRDKYRCRWILPDGTRCGWSDPTGDTLECDHVNRGDDHRLDNLQTLCGRGSPANHHQTKTILERRAPRRRPMESHPGEIA